MLQQLRLPLLGFAPGVYLCPPGSGDPSAHRLKGLTLLLRIRPHSEGGIICPALEL
jgi:hypothetical protein